jgi:hypothetical protein
MSVTTEQPAATSAIRPFTFEAAPGGPRRPAGVGLDVDEEGNGSLRDGRLYQLVRQAGEACEPSCTEHRRPTCCSIPRFTR